MKISMNSDVVITLTARGAEIVNEHNKKILSDPHLVWSTLRTDHKEGDKYIGMLWQIMELFAPYCHSGEDVCFTTLEPEHVEEGGSISWRPAFNAISEEGIATPEDIYFVTEDKNFLVKMPKGETQAICLSIAELNKLQVEYE